MNYLSFMRGKPRDYPSLRYAKDAILITQSGMHIVIEITKLGNILLYAVPKKPDSASTFKHNISSSLHIKIMDISYAC